MKKNDCLVVECRNLIVKSLKQTSFNSLTKIQLLGIVSRTATLSCICKHRYVYNEMNVSHDLLNDLLHAQYIKKYLSRIKFSKIKATLA